MAESRSYAFDVTGKGLRALYGEISERIAAGIVSGGRRFHAVFPPGTDRGRIVSYVMSNTRLKTIIVSPNAARRQYWKARRAHHADLYDAAASTWSNVPGQMVSTNPFSCAPVLTLTYKQLGESRTTRLDQDAIKRFATHAVRQGYKLIVLDECTELPEVWKEELLTFVREADAAVIGFSSYPPDETSAWYAHCKEAVKMEIPVPVAVLQGALAPYRHHVAFHKLPSANADADRLIQSSEKIHPVLGIVAEEMRRHGPDARIAMLMDPHALTHVRSDGLIDGIRILRSLGTRQETAGHSPIMLTGAAVIVPTASQQDFAEAIQREAQNREWDLGLQLRANDEFSEIAGEGRDWNSATYVDIVRMLLRHGLGGCVLLSPEILTWGLQQLPFNTVIDLTSDSRVRYMHVPEAPKEVAIKTCDASVNYWDIVCLSPTGGADWERLLTKHSATECPTPESVIELGPGAVDMRLPAMNPVNLYEDVDDWNSGQFERAVHRKDWAGIWKRTVSAGSLAESVVVVPWKEFPSHVHCEAMIRDLLTEDAQVITQRKATMKLHHTLWTVLAISASLISFLTLPREIAMYVSAAVLVFLLGKIITKWWSVSRAKFKFPLVSRKEYLHRAALAVFSAYADTADTRLPEPEDGIHVSEREDGTYRVVYSIPDEAAAMACRRAFMELFAQNPVSPYTLEVKAFQAGKTTTQKLIAATDFESFYSPHYTLAVPSVFAESKAHAELFRTSWQEYVARAELHPSNENIPVCPPFREIAPASVRIALCRM